MGQIRVAVIGAGAAGLAALKHLKARPNVYEATAFEQTGCVGGTWVYTDRVKTDENGLPIHSSMYNNLRTNLPKEVMAFPGFPFPKELPSFMMHYDVLQYLEDFANHFKLKESTQFYTKVDLVEPIWEAGKLLWRVTTSKIRPDNSTSNDSDKHTGIYDSVMVCNGHYSQGLVPQIDKIEEFDGVVMHSHDYRNNETFKGKRVLVLGAAASGSDIALDVAPVASEVFLSHWKPAITSPLADNVKQVPAVKRATKNGFMLQNDEEVQVDAAIWCTGYHYNYSFLSKDCQLKIEDERVTPLYKHLVHTKLPTLFIIGVCKTILPFPQFDGQVQFAMAALEGNMVLPSTEEMDADIQKDYEWRRNTLNFPHRYAHHLANLQWDYNKDIAKLGGFEPIPDVKHELYDHVHDYRAKNLTTYKKINFELVGNTFKDI